MFIKIGIRFAEISKSQKLEMRILLNEKIKKDSEHSASFFDQKNWPLLEGVKVCCLQKVSLSLGPCAQFSSNAFSFNAFSSNSIRLD